MHWRLEGLHPGADACATPPAVDLTAIIAEALEG